MRGSSPRMTLWMYSRHSHNHRPHPEERALARVSKDGFKTHCHYASRSPGSRRAQECALLTMRALPRYPPCHIPTTVRDGARSTLERGDTFDGLSVGSFTSVESANRLVNSTISDNQDKIDQGIRDGEPEVVISKSFKSPTGYEACLARAHAEPVIRDTFGVKVVIEPDPGSARGWRVHTAYPIR
jgi:Bacterial CdiA-CT RNAse A domain